MDQQQIAQLYTKRLLKKKTMDFRRFLPDMKTWTLREMTCAAGVLALSAGAAFCLYRGFSRRSAPIERVQPAREPVDVLGESTHTPSFLQVTELNQLLLPTEPHQEPTFVEPPLHAGELNSAYWHVQFVSSDFYGGLTGSVKVQRSFLGMMRGPERLLCWFTTTQTRHVDPNGFPDRVTTGDSFTGIQHVSGRVTRFISCNREERANSMPLERHGQTLKTVINTYLYVGADGREDTFTWSQQHPHCSPYGYLESEPDFEEDDRTPEEKEVPFICAHLADSGISDIGLKLCPLRQAFSTLLDNVHILNFFFVAGKKIVTRLAAANNQDAVGVQLIYESLIRFLGQPSNQSSIKAELSEAQLQHYNFVEVFFELLLFRCFSNGEVPEASEGGFLERLFSLINMWNVDDWEPAAALYFTVLIDELTVLCEVLFSQPVERYSDPAALASATSRLVLQYVQLMMDTLETL